MALLGYTHPADGGSRYTIGREEDVPVDGKVADAEVKRIRGKKNPRSVAALKSLRDEHTWTIEPARAQAAEARHLERRLSDLVNEAYGLTPDEVSVMWQTAPPRMTFVIGYP